MGRYGPIWSLRKLACLCGPIGRITNARSAWGGIARVGLAPIFLETIEGDYLVHVTPYGNASLYVAEIGKDHFVVKAREGDPNAIFAWRLSAHRKGYAGVKLEEAD
jgi:hypothetical protein